MTDQVNDKETDENGQSDLSVRKRRRGLYFFVFFLSAWMFFLGVLVGRGTAPVGFDIQELHRQIAELKQRTLRNERNKSREMPSETPEPKPVIGFYDELKREGSYEDLYAFQNPELAEENAEVAPAPAPEEPSFADRPGIAEPEKRRPADPPVTAKPENAKPVENESMKNYSIQVISSQSKEEADKLVEKYIKKGYPAYRLQANLKDGGVWHRVRIGPFKGYSEAQSVLSAVKKERGGALILEH